MQFDVPTIRKTGWNFAAALLLAPAIAMQFTADVNWGPGDFLAAALLLGVTGVSLEIAVALPRRQWRSRGAALAVAVLMLVWLELAVGIAGPG